MKNILIALNDVVTLSMLRRQRNFSPEIKLFFTKEGGKVLDITKAEKIDLLITSLSLPGIDVLELMLNMIAYNPAIKIAFFVRDEHEHLENLTSFYWILKPCLLEEAVRFIREVHIIEYQAPSIANITVTDFLRLLEQQQKTCSLRIKNKLTQETGLIYFKYGILFDAVCGELKARFALLEMLSWPDVVMSFEPFNEGEFHRQIAENLAALIEHPNGITNEITNEAIPNVVVESKLEEVDFALETKLQVEEIAKAETEAKAKAEAEAKVKAEKDAKAKAEAEAKAKAEKEAKVKAEVEAKAKAEKEAKAKVEAEAKAKAEKEAKAKAEAEVKAKAEKEAKAKAEAEVKAKAEKEAKAKAISERINKLALDEVLTPLQAMSHYLAALVFDIAGNQLVKYDINRASNEEVLAEHLILLENIALNAVEKLESNPDYIQINCDKGIFNAVFDFENQFIAAVLLESTATNSGLAKINLTKISLSLRKQLASMK